MGFSAVNIWFWVWLLLAGICLVAEIIEGGFLYLPWSLGSAAAALIEFVRPADGPDASLWAQWIVFVGISSVVLVVLRRRFHPQPPRRRD